MRESEQPFFGRTEHLSRVERALADARRGVGGTLVIKGEAGIGKTTLLNRVLASAGDLLVLHAAGVEPEAELPFAGLHLLLRRVEARFDDLVGDRAATLRCALGLRGRADAADGHSVNLAVLALLTALAAERPVVVAVDDAHWLDRPSVDALLFAARRVEGLPLAVLFTVRDGYAPALPTPGLPELRVEGLADTDADALLTAQAPELTAHERRQVLVEARGNPLALLELRRTRSDRAALTTLDTGPPLEGTLLAAFARRVADLPPTTRTVVLIAAADGACGTGTVLAAADRLGAGLDDLAAAEDAGLLAFDDSCLRFGHPLVRAAAYRSASLPDRIAAHRALAAVLTSPDDADRRAWQLAAAATGPDEEVAAALEHSVEHARARGGYAAVAAAYERAAALSPGRCGRARRLSAAARAAADAGSPDRALALVREAEQFCTTTAGRVAAATIHAVLAQDQHRFDEAYEVLRDTALRVADDDPASASHLLFWAGHSAWFGGDAAKAEHAASTAERLGLASAPALRSLVRAASGSPVEAADALRALVDTAAHLFPACDDRPLRWRGRLAVATWRLLLHDHAAARDTALTVLRECRAEASDGVLAPALSVLARAEFALGEHRRARDAAEEGLRLADEAGQAGPASELSGVLALLAALRGDAEATAAHARRASLADASHAFALLDLGRGRHDAALHHLDAAPRGGVTGWLPTAAALAEATARTHNADTDPNARHRRWHRARDAVDTYAQATRHSGTDRTRAVTLRMRALLAECAPEGCADEPDALYARAVDLHRRDPHAAFDRARTELGYGEFLRRRRRTTEARAHLRTASTIFEKLGAQAWAERARTELRASGEQLRPHAAGSSELIARLTPQEQRVVGLAAHGLSNRAIGERLFLSPRTVGYHLYKAFPKLGVASRRELARLGLPG
ncbi:ATP-binding protein [Saccharomonospora azurea]